MLTDKMDLYWVVLCLVLHTFSVLTFVFRAFSSANTKVRNLITIMWTMYLWNIYCFLYWKSIFPMSVRCASVPARTQWIKIELFVVFWSLMNFLFFIFFNFFWRNNGSCYLAIDYKVRPPPKNIQGLDWGIFKKLRGPEGSRSFLWKKSVSKKKSET